MGDVIDMEDRKRVWTNGFFRCASCGFHAISTYHVQANTNALECGKCGRMTGQIIPEEDWHKSRGSNVKPFRPAPRR